MKNIFFITFNFIILSLNAQVKIGNNLTNQVSNSSFQVEGDTTNEQLVVLKNGQVAIGTVTPDPSAALDVTSTTKGFLPPRLTTTERALITAPEKGLIIYNLTDNCLQVNDGTPTTPEWNCISGIPAPSVGTITSLSCASATANGTLISGTAASSVSSVISYTGGNGIAHTGQTVTSTGVTGLTASLAAGTFATGSGTLSYSITGTPANSGTASFALNIGGQSCTLTRTVTAIAIATLNCTSATNNGTLTQNVAASGVNSVISYTGGNGTSHSGQTVTSTGVSGLTATLAAGTFASGSGTLTYTITGTPTNGGIASFAISIGGQSCTITRFVSVPSGSGSFLGKTCFDIARGNNNVAPCGALTARTANQSDFTLASTHTQTYSFTPIGTVSNVRFAFINTNGDVITAISGDNAGNNISTAVTATVNYNTNLNTLASGLNNTNPLSADIIVIYNDGATNNGADLQLKISAKIKDCDCCEAKISATATKEFLCHNLGANPSLNPHSPVVGLQGGYVQWGRRGPNTTGDSRNDWRTAANTSNFAAAPTATNSNSVMIAGWSQTTATDYSWRTVAGAKTANDPCPTGYRVPTDAEWTGVKDNNTISRTGTWTTGFTSYDSAIHFGPNASTKLLTLPTTGAYNFQGELQFRGSYGYYWSSTESGTAGLSARNIVFYDTGIVVSTTTRLGGSPVRCIAE